MKIDELIGMGVDLKFDLFEVNVAMSGQASLTRCWLMQRQQIQK